MEFNIVDGIIVVFLILSSLIGYYQGLIASFFNLFGYIIALIVTRFYFISFKELVIKNTQVDEWINTFVVDRFSYTGSTRDKINMDYIKSLKLPEEMLEAIKKYEIVEDPNQFIQSLRFDFTSNISDVFLTIFSFVVFFIIVLILIKVVVGMLNIVANLPVIKSFNKFGGLLFGGLKGLLILFIVSLIALPILSFNDTTGIIELIDKSVLGNIIIEFNFIIIIIGKIILGIQVIN